MRGFIEFLGNFNTITGLAVLFGVPVSVFAGIGAGIWARIENLRISYISVLVLLVFGLTLWSWIGIIWLVDRAKKPITGTSRSSPDCAWGLILENAIIKFDANGLVERQVSVTFRNLLSWPVRVEIVAKFLEV